LARSRGSRFPRRGASRRPVGWEEGPFTTPLALSTNGATIFSGGQQVLLDGLTIIRLRGSLMCKLTTVTALGDGFSRVAVGFCVVSENASGVGATAVPHPIADIQWDGWFWHTIFNLRSEPTTAEVWADPMGQWREIIDSKAMRKTRAGDVIIGVVEVAGEIGTAVINLVANTRVLIKLT